MSNIKIQSPQTSVENRAFQDRLQQLGLKPEKDGSIDPKSVEGLRLGRLEGLEALKAVLDPAGKLDAAGASTLTRARSFVGIDLGRTATIDQKQSDAVRSITMSLEGLSTTLARASSGIEAATAQTRKTGSITAQKGGAREGSLDLDALAKVERQLEALDKAWSKSALSGPTLGNVDPAALRSFVHSLEFFAGTNAQFVNKLSDLRSAVLDVEPQGKLAKMGLNWIANTVSGPLDQLLELQKVAGLMCAKVATPRAEAKPPRPAEQAQSAANDLASGIFDKAGVRAIADAMVSLTNETKLDMGTIKTGFDRAITKTFIAQRSGSASTILDMIDSIRRDQDIERAAQSQRDAPIRAKKAAAGDLYATLGVTRSASADEIKTAFRKLARDNHPDLHPGDASKAALMQAINKANDTISDPSKRGTYDRGSATAGVGYAAAFDLPPAPPPREKPKANTVDERADQLMTEHAALIRLVSNVAREQPANGKAFLERLNVVLNDPGSIVSLASERLALPAPSQQS